MSIFLKNKNKEQVSLSIARGILEMYVWKLGRPCILNGWVNEIRVMRIGHDECISEWQRDIGIEMDTRQRQNTPACTGLGNCCSFLKGKWSHG